MSASTPNNQDQEIDLSVLVKKIGGFFEDILSFVFNAIQFVKKRILIFAALFIIGVVLGFLKDGTSKFYKSEVIVAPNFGSTDYLYDKIAFLNAKLVQEDSVFLASLGIKDFEKIEELDVNPVIDIFNLVNNNASASANNAQNSQNFELVKLLAETTDIKTVIKDPTTSKNYQRHTVEIITKGYTSNAEILDPIIKFLNQNEYYGKYRKIYANNIANKIIQNDVIIGQIDGLLAQFSANKNNSQRGDKLIYYNENTQLNDLLTSKTALQNENMWQKVQLVSYDQIIKENSRTTNMRYKKSITTRKKLVYPITLILLYLGYLGFMAFYKKQEAKLL